jgi:hypothetical protein
MNNVAAKFVCRSTIHCVFAIYCPLRSNKNIRNKT